MKLNDYIDKAEKKEFKKVETCETNYLYELGITEEFIRDLTYRKEIVIDGLIREIESEILISALHGQNEAYIYIPACLEEFATKFLERANFVFEVFLDDRVQEISEHSSIREVKLFVSWPEKSEKCGP